MKIKNLMQEVGGPRLRFHLNVGGFTVKNCRWNRTTREIRFPVRYDTNRRRYRVIFVRGALVNRLRGLLESGEMALPRNRRPCTLRIHFLGQTPYYPEWMIFDFTVRGFTICGCRWQPTSGSIQLPVTFFFDPNARRYRRKKRVVCAYGAHINRLRLALVNKWYRVYGYPQAEAPALVAEDV